MPQIAEAYGSLLAEMGEEDQAIAVLRKVVSMSPDEGHEKYMYLGQLLEGEEAVAMTRKGIEVLQRLLDRTIADEGEAGKKEEGHAKVDKEEEEEEEEAADMDGVERDGQDGDEDEDAGPVSVEDLRGGLCSALCSLAEMVMEQAESLDPGSEVCEEVEALLRRATATCSSSPEPGQALASLRYEQGRPEEALGLLRGSMKLWFKEDAEEGEEGGEEAMEDEEDEGGVLPSYEFRFECAKLLLELDDHTDTAVAVRSPL